MKLMNEFYNLYTPVKPEGQAQGCILWRSMVTNPLGVDNPVSMWAITIIMLAYSYCTAYTRMTMSESSPLCEQRRITFNDDGQRVPLARPVLQRHITFACAGCYQLHAHHRPGIITPTCCRYQFTSPERMIAWLAKADCTHITFAQRYYTIESKGIRRKWNRVVGSKTNSIPVNQPRRTS